MIKNPIIIIGTGRSGSTIFHKVLSRHQELGGISRILNTSPTNFKMHKLYLNGIDLPIVGSKLFEKYWIGEGYKFWDHYSKGFSVPFRDLNENDLSERSKLRILDATSKLVTNSRNRLLLKITGWPRIGFLQNIYPDAKFIHIIRDGRAVTNSLLNVNWWWGWRGPSNWRWGDLSQQHYDEWLRHKKSFVALAAIEWKILMDALEIGKNSIAKENFLEIKYEDLCNNPVEEYRKVLEFSNLKNTDKFNKEIRKTAFRNTNIKWENELSRKQKEILNAVLKDYLIKYGYNN